MDQENINNSVGNMTGGKVIMAGHIDKINIYGTPEQHEIIPDDAWARRVSESSLWLHVRKNSNSTPILTAATGLASDLSDLRNKSEDHLREDPWLDPGLPIRFLERIESLFGAPQPNNDLDLYPTEAAILALMPFLIRVYELRKAKRLAKVTPGHPRSISDADPLRQSFETFIKGHSALLRRVQRVPEAEIAVGWWLFHQWILLPQNTDGPEGARSLLKPLNYTSSALERALNPTLVTRCFTGLRLGSDVCSSKYLDSLSVDEPVRGHPDQRVREQRLILVLSLAFGMAIEMASLPVVVAERVGASRPVRLSELGRTLDGAHWGGLKKLPELQANCHHPAVTDGLKQHVTKVEHLLNRMHQTVNKRITQPMPDLPLRLSADGLQSYDALASTQDQASNNTLINLPSTHPPKRSRSFVGRAELISQIHSNLRATEGAQPPIALTGMSGIGKTEIAKEYAHRHASEYDLVWWIPSASEEQIRNSFAAIAKNLGINIPDSNDSDLARSVLEALRQVQKLGQWLLIFDNAGTHEDIRSYLPTAGDGHVVVTSRDQSWSPKNEGCLSAPVTVFSRDESIELLQIRGPKGLSISESDQVAEALGDLPLAVNQAAVWMSETGSSGTEYVRKLTEKHQEYVHLLDSVDSEYPIPVAAAWNVSLARLAVSNRAALQLLKVCSFMASTPIPRDLFALSREIEGPLELRRSLEDPMLLGMTIRDIGRHSLAHLDFQGDTLSLHRLVAMAVQASMMEEEKEELRHCAHQLLAYNHLEGNFTEIQRRDAILAPHVWASKTWACTNSSARELVIRLCDGYLERMEFTQVLQLGHKARTTWSRELGSEHKDTLRIVLRMSEALLGQGESDQARELIESSRTRIDKTSG